MWKKTRIVAALGMMWIPLAARGAGPATQSASQPAADYAAEFDRSQHYAGDHSWENLDRIRKGLDVPETRMAAVRELIDYAGMSMYQVGSVIITYPDGSTNNRQEAAKAAHGAADEATILKALNGDDAVLIFWGIWHFQKLNDKQAALPILWQLARGKDETLRSRAVEMLVRNGEKDVAAQLAATEKSPRVLDDMLFAGKPTGAAALNKRLEELLKDPDVEVRSKVLEFIGRNWIAAAARQIYLDATLMDSILACAQGKGADAPVALETFQTSANRELADADAAAAWWKEHRSDWELARFPRSERPNGSPIYASIVTTGEVGPKSEWQASIILENRGQKDIYVNVTANGMLEWILYDANGKRVDTGIAKNDAAAPNWVDMQAGQMFTKVSAIVLSPGPAMKAGRYTLRAAVRLGTDTRGLPKDVPSLSVEIPLPTIVVVVGK